MPENETTKKGAFSASWGRAPEAFPGVPDTDQFGNPVEAFSDVRPHGAGEKAVCTSCRSSRRHIAMYAATVPAGDVDDDREWNENWEEYYICSCGATGTFQNAGDERKWSGQMEYPDSEH